MSHNDIGLDLKLLAQNYLKTEQELRMLEPEIDGISGVEDTYEAYKSAKEALIGNPVALSMAILAKEQQSLRWKADFPAERLADMPAVMTEILTALQKMPSGTIKATLDGPELAWALERLGLPAEGAKQLVITYRKEGEQP